jgi:hypothetical protein
MVAVGMEGHDKEGRIVVKGIVAGDGEEEVALDVLILGAPDFFATFIDDGVLVWVVSDGGGTGQGGKEVGEELSFWGDGKRKVREDGSGRGRGGDDSDGGFNDRRWEILDRDVCERDPLDDFFKLVVDVCVLVFDGRGVLKLRAYNVSLLGGDGGEDVEEVGWGDGNGGQGTGAIGVRVHGGTITTWAWIIPDIVGTVEVVLDDLVGGGDINLVGVVDLGPIGNRKGGGDDEGR